MLGWIFPKTRKWNLVTLSLTAFSWFVLGIWFGWGYCLCTDWHWQVRRHLGYYDESHSYIHFLVLKLTGFDLPTKLVDDATLGAFVISLVISMLLNIRDRRRRSAKFP